MLNGISPCMIGAGIILNSIIHITKHEHPITHTHYEI
jgi:hypothetical protein